VEKRLLTVKIKSLSDSCKLYGIMYRIFRGKETLEDKLWDVLFIVFAVAAFIAVASARVTSEANLIPTITNGVTASTSIIIAANGLIVTFAHTSKVKKDKVMINRTYYSFVFILLVIMFIFLTYLALMSGDNVKGIQTGMTGLIIALANFADFSLFVLRRYVEPALPK
jgi:hypothetical protein